MKKTLFVVIAMALVCGLPRAQAQAHESKAAKIPILFESSFTSEATGDNDRALNDVLQILRIDSNHYIANLRAGWLYYLKGRWNDSIKFYKKAVTLKAGSIEPNLGLMLPLMASKNWSRAEKVAQELDKRAPGNYLVGSRLAFIYFSQGKYSQAEKKYKEVLDAYPSEIEMVLGLGWTYLKQGRSGLARNMFTQVLTIRRQNLNARAGLEALGK